MEIEEAKQILQTYHFQSSNEQCVHKGAITEAFQVFWASKPTLEEFETYLTGIVLFPAILYHIVQGRSGANGSFS